MITGQKRKVQAGPCPKCGSDRCTLNYVQERDRLRVKCDRCGYGWWRDPLNKDGEAT